MRYELKPLPYSYDALSPVISKEIMELHHDKHHLAYVNGANTALKLIEKMRTGESINIKAVLRDLSFNLNGHLLHELFWENMRKPIETNVPEKEVLKTLEKTFGSFEVFKNEFSQAALTVEGSGWTGLFRDSSNNLLIGQIEKHNNLGINGFTPVLVLDVWEHAYYLDYKNDRKKYIEEWWKIVNWDFVKQKLQ